MESVDEAKANSEKLMNEFGEEFVSILIFGYSTVLQNSIFIIYCSNLWF